MLFLIFFITTATAINLQQVKNRFCVIHGLNKTAILADKKIKIITDVGFIKSDKIKALKMILASILIAAVYTFLVFKASELI